MLTFALYGLLAIGLVGGLFMLAARLLPAGEQIAPPIRDEPIWAMPADRALSAADVSEVRLPVALRGYRFAETDLLLDRLGEELRARDEQIARLRGELPHGQRPVEPDESAAGETFGVAPPVADDVVADDVVADDVVAEGPSGENTAGEAPAGEPSAGQAPAGAPASYWGGSLPSRPAVNRPEPVVMADAAPAQDAPWWGKPAPGEETTAEPDEAPARRSAVPPPAAPPAAIPQPEPETGLAPTWWQPPPTVPPTAEPPQAEASPAESERAEER